jgi:type IV pilus assembly protein PilC
MENNQSKKSMGSIKVKPLELSLFCYQMSIILRSGIQISEGLTMLSDEVSDKHLRDALESMSRDIENGYSFYSSIENQDIFPGYMKAMVMIGEKTGSLDNVMDYLSHYFERNDRLNQKIKSAVTYPLILAGLMAGIILLLILKVLPMFNDILEAVGGEMPSVTKVMLDISIGIKDNLLIIFGILVVLMVIVYFIIKTPFGRNRMDILRINLPFVGGISKKIYAARFSMVMSLLVKSGIDHDDALDMVKDVIGNDYAAAKITECREMILVGKDIREAYSQVGIFPGLFLKMINIGYRTGEMDSMMSKISKIYENDVDNSLNRAASVIEPALVIVLSLVIGVILLTVMLPLINIMSSIG